MLEYLSNSSGMDSGITFYHASIWIYTMYIVEVCDFLFNSFSARDMSEGHPSLC